MNTPKQTKTSTALVPSGGNGARPVTLAMMDAMPVPSGRHASLAELSPDQMGLMLRGLDEARGRHESMSGTCAALAGLVCIEAKARLAHGEYLPWLKTHLGKSRETATQYTAVAKAFVKCQPKLTFEQMTLALMDGEASANGEAMDLTHPVVSAVAAWTKGRTFYELRGEFCGAKPKGGKTYERVDGKGRRKQLTAEEAKAALHALAIRTAEHSRAAYDQRAYIALNAAERHGLIDHLQELAAAAKAWEKLSVREREHALAEVLKTCGEDAEPAGNLEGRKAGKKGGRN